MKIGHNWYTQNEDHPELNDESTIEYDDGVLVVDCNGDRKSYRVEGSPPTVEDFHKVETNFGDEPICADDPSFICEVLGLKPVAVLQKDGTEVPVPDWLAKKFVD